MKCYFVLFISVVLLSCIIACQDSISKDLSENNTKAKPNIVLIMTDDQGWGDLSMNGHQDLETPNIDALAASGISFDRFYVSPVCSPTRAEILTGRYAVRGGVYSTSAGGERLDLDETTIGDVFKAAGYNTAAYGKWHNGMQAGYHPNARGFDDFYGFCSGHWGNYFDPMLEHNGEIVKGKGYIADDLTDHGLSFIEENKSEPFFLYLPYCTPHSPMQVPDKWFAKYQNVKLTQQGTEPSKEDVEHTKAALAMCENIDWNVGRIMQQLKTLELLENTIVLFLSDNGPNGHRWNGGMRGTKGSTDEGGIRSPLMLSWKGTLDSNRTVKKIASSIDILPTLCDLVGIETTTNKPIDGVSIKSLLVGNEENWKDRMVTSYWKDRISVRSQGHRLDSDERLYDMIQDPFQGVDVAKDHPDIFKALVDEKQKYISQVLIELPKVDERTFDVGHPNQTYTQLPARDGTAYGNIKRSNKYPNCSYFTNWTDLDDVIVWEAEVLESGEFEVDLYYTCPPSSIGSKFAFSIGDEQIETVITEAHDPPDKGMEHDRIPRQESYVKDFRKKSLGRIRLKEGPGEIKLKALEIKGDELMDVRMLMLKRVNF